MAKGCNGVISKPRKSCKRSSVEVVDARSLDEVSKITFGKPLATGFPAFISRPHVRLERYDITPYLNERKKPVIRVRPQKKRGKIDVHAQRLSQKCLVKIARDDLEKLKAAFQKSPQPSSDVSSDSEDDSSSDMAVKCKICDKSYTSDKKLLKHQQKKHIIYKTPNKTPKRVSFSDHVIIHEVEAYHKCRKCPKIFEDYKYLKKHMRQWHKKRKCYICNYCNKKFVDRMFFKVHIRLHCDSCGSLFSRRSKFLEHRRDKCRVFKLYKCKTCSESFFKVMDLKDHSYDHVDYCLVCDICKEQFTSKCAVAHHIAFLHSEKKRPNELYVMRKMGTERLYLCKFCEESSVERDIIENHIQKLPDLSNKATTGYKDYYFCDQCMKKFDTETDMLQHKWSHFLKTSDNSQERPKSILTPHKNMYNINDIPEHFKLYVVLDVIKDLSAAQHVDATKDTSEVSKDISEVNNPCKNSTVSKKAKVCPKSKKTLFSKHQCETCGRYFSNNYCLNRHISSQHEDFDKLRCKVCEEIFVWPSLLKSHKCIRLNHPEMPFDDARAEILFDNLYVQNGFDDLNLNIGENDDYLHEVDFEIPAPVIELRECDSTLTPNFQNEITMPDKNGLTGYKLVMQEVPIEF